jgi:PITH domain
MSCSSESNAHHDHHHDDDHSHDIDPSAGLQYTLYKCIDTDRVTALNEVDDGSCRHLFKAHDQRLDRTLSCTSDVDEQLIIHIPFTGSVKVTSMCVIGAGDASPLNVRAWVNRNDVDFDNCVDLAPAQSWQMAVNGDGKIEYPTDPVKFQNIASLTLFVEDNHGGAEQTVLYYVGLKGNYLRARVTDAVHAVYEARALPEDHKAADEMSTPSILQ